MLWDEITSASDSLTMVVKGIDIGSHIPSILNEPNIEEMRPGYLVSTSVSKHEIEYSDCLFHALVEPSYS